MAQFGRPDADNHVGNWDTDGGGTTNLFQQIDEASPSDVDYIRSEVAPSNSPYCCGVSSVEDPQSSSGHIVRIRLSKDAAGGSQIDATVQLRQDYVSEASQGTLIRSEAFTNVSETWTTQSFTLSAGEADSITDYASLDLRVVANQV